MSDIDDIFSNLKIKVGSLPRFGFVPSEKSYFYTTSLLNGQFEMTVTITKAGKVTAKVIDTHSKTEYMLHRLAGAQGKFVGKVRQEYESVLNKIANACFEPDIFKSKQVKQVIKYIREQYQDEPEFLWKRLPKNAIFRRKDNRKWYAALLNLPKQKLGLSGRGNVDILDLKCEPMLIKSLTDKKTFFPVYHMNKKHWITVLLDSSKKDKDLFPLIDQSYQLNKK